MKKATVITSAIVTAFVISTAFSQVESVRASTPEGWMKTGTAPQNYQFDTVQSGSRNTMRIASNESAKSGEFGTIMQTIDAQSYLGQSVRLKARLRTENVQDWGGIWMRIGGRTQFGMAFDNMQDRAPKGTTSWKEYEIVLPVGQDAKSVNFGLLLAGKGTIEMSDLSLVTVAANTPATGATSLPKAPVNLEFKK